MISSDTMKEESRNKTTTTRFDLELDATFISVFGINYACTFVYSEHGGESAYCIISLALISSLTRPAPIIPE